MEIKKYLLSLFIFLPAVCRADFVVIDSFMIDNSSYTKTEQTEVLLTKEAPSFSANELKSRITDTGNQRWAVYEVTFNSIDEADAAKNEMKNGSFVHLLRTLYGNIDGELKAVRMKMGDIPFDASVSKSENEVFAGVITEGK